MVHVEVRNGVVVGGEALVHELLIVDVAGLHAEVVVEHLGGIDGVAYPRYILDVVFASFVDGDVDVDGLFVVRHNAVGHNTGVTEAFLVVFLEDEVKVVAVVALHKLLLAEDFEEVEALVSLLHCTLEGAVGEHLVAVDINLVHLHLVVLVDDDVDEGLVLV